MKKIIGIVVAVIVIVVVAGLVMGPRGGDSSAVRATVEAFGNNMQKVSLLAPTSTASVAIDQAYGKYVAPDLLAQWEQNPSQAPGRLTSSPWPDHIEIGTTTKQANDLYSVQGSVVEKTSAGEGAHYPVNIMVAKQGNAWLITHFDGYPPVSAPQAGAITQTGTMVCLPHKDTSGPQTMECAFGIKTDSGRYYALSDNTPDHTLFNVPTNARLTVTGTFAPRSNSNYQDIGVITVESVTVS